MSQTPLLPAPGSSSNFQSVFDTALNQYQKKTKNDLLAHQLTTQLESCTSPSAILAVLDEQYHIQQFIQSQNDNERPKQWLNATANVICAFSATISGTVGLVFSPANVIFTGIGVLVAAAKDVGASQDTVTDLFGRIESLFERLETYTEVPSTHAMMDTIVKIIIEVLGILAIATKEIKQGSTKKYLNKLLGKTDIEDALKRLDKLTHDEALMATAQILKLAHTIDDKVTGIDSKVTKIINDGREAGEAAKEGEGITRQTADDVDEMKRSQLRENLRRWLSPPDSSTNYNMACDAHHKGTAEWFFQSSIFKEWKSTGSLLWVHGKPGSGKSILCSTIIRDIITLHDGGLASMAYFYFDFRDVNKQKRHDLLTSLVTQLSARSNRNCDVLSALYFKHDSGGQKPNEYELVQCLKKMISLPDQHPTYLIIDALDECSNMSGMPSPREQVLGLLKELVGLSLPNLRICVTSRPEVDIRNALEPVSSRHLSLHDQGGQKKDIADYVTSVVHSDPEMRRWREEDRESVIETVSERAEGMFRWVFCQLEALRYCFPSSVRHMLDELPETLDETYERMLRNIHKAKRDHAHRLLQCLAVAARPLRIAELAEILAIDFGTAMCRGISRLNINWRLEDQQHAVLSTCSSLITVVDQEDTQVVQFSHFSVKEFLTSPRLARSNPDVLRFHISFEPAHTVLAKACLGVLLRLDDRFDGYEVHANFPLAQYAAKHWVDHAQFGDVSSQVQKGMEELFDPMKPCFAAWLRLDDKDASPLASSALFQFTVESQVRVAAAPLYYAALCGFRGLVEHLIFSYPEQVNAIGGYHVSPLGAALGAEHFKVAQLLYEHDADVDVRGHGKRTLLYGASYGHRGIVEWLLHHGADPNIRDGYGRTPLHFAVEYGPTEITEILLQYKAVVNAQDDAGRTLLHVASSKGHVDSTRLLLKHGADVNTQDKKGITPLHVVDGVDIARLLVEHGANLDLEDFNGRTVSRAASGRGRLDLEKWLLDHGSK